MRKSRSRYAKPKPRRSVRWAPVFAVILVPVVIAGAFRSPITRLTRIQAHGVAPSDQPAVGAYLKSLRDIPFAQVNVHNPASLISDIPEIRTAELSGNIFGRGRLEVTYRRPVAQVEGVSTLAVDEYGAIYTCREIPDGLPHVAFAGGLPAPNVTLAANWPAEAVAQLAMRVAESSAIRSDKPLRIDVLAGGALCLNIGAVRVELGGPYNLAEKLDKLERVLVADPAILQRVKRLNFVAPDFPAQAPLLEYRSRPPGTP